MIVHEHFIGGDETTVNITWYDNNANDIALFELNAPLPDNVTSIGALCLANGSYPIEDGLPSFVIGWGRTMMTGSELVLKEAIVPVISNVKCHSWMPVFNIGEKMICAGYEEGGVDSCAGDSGGPLFVYNVNFSRYELFFKKNYFKTDLFPAATIKLASFLLVTDVEPKRKQEFTLESLALFLG